MRRRIRINVLIPEMWPTTGPAVALLGAWETGRNLSSATVNRVAQRVGRTPAQVLLRWCLEHDF